MSLLSRDHLLFASSIVALILLHFILSSSCLQKFPLPPSQEMVMEDKIRLGSTPPNCHNRCNQCDPCKAVQVPTLPTRSDRPGPAQGRDFPTRPLDYQQSYDRSSNYKPLGWKCRCGNCLYNP